MPDRVDKPCAEKDTIPDQFFAPVAVTSPISPPDRRVADIRSRAAAMRRAVGPGIRTIIWRALRPLHTGVRLRSYRFPVPSRRRSPQITSSRARTTRIPQPEAQVAATRRHMCVGKPAGGAVETMSEGIRRKGFFRYLWSQYGVYGCVLCARSASHMMRFLTRSAPHYSHRAVTLVTVDVSAFVGSYIALTNSKLTWVAPFPSVYLPATRTFHPNRL